MSSFHYHLLWLLAGLALVALISATLTRRLRRHAQRHAQARTLLDALTRYAVWVAVQRSGGVVESDRAIAEAALREAGDLQARWFPALRPALETLIESDRRLHAFVREQQALRVHDPEAWLDSQPAAVATDLWQDHTHTLQSLIQETETAATRRAPCA